MVFHLAAVVGNAKFSAQPNEGYDVNVTGTLAVLNYCHRVAAKCVVTTTSGVYRPNDGGGPISEDSPIDPRQPYTISKWLAENVCIRQATDLNIPCVVLRVFNVFGEGQDSSFLVPHVLGCLQSGELLTLRMPQALRDFVYVDDVVEALVKAWEYPGQGFSIFNIGTGQATRVIDLVHLAEKVTGKSAAIEVNESGTDEPVAVIADISKARREIGWSPRYDLNQGLLAMVCRSSVVKIPEAL